MAQYDYCALKVRVLAELPFLAKKLPLSVGTRTELIERLAAIGFSKKKREFFCRVYFGSTRYMLNTLTHPHRYSIEGKCIVNAVTVEQRLWVCSKVLKTFRVAHKDENPFDYAIRGLAALDEEDNDSRRRRSKRNYYSLVLTCANYRKLVKTMRKVDVVASELETVCEVV
ncbi:hypothetical protein AB4254_08305 [Vibrio breoganii]